MRENTLSFSLVFSINNNNNSLSNILVSSRNTILLMFHSRKHVASNATGNSFLLPPPSPPLARYAQLPPPPSNNNNTTSSSPLYLGSVSAMFPEGMDAKQEKKWKDKEEKRINTWLSLLKQEPDKKKVNLLIH